MQKPDEQISEQIKNEFDITREYLLDRDKKTSNLLLDFAQHEITAKIPGRPAMVFQKLKTLKDDKNDENPSGDENWNHLLPSDARSIPKEGLETTLDKTDLLRLSRNIREKVEMEASAVRVQPSFYLQCLFGLLSWKRDGEKKLSKAPLIFIPIEVKLDKSETNHPLKFRWRNADPFLNPSLPEKLRQQGVQLPDSSIFIHDGPAKYFDAVTKELKKTGYDELGWSVEQETYLSLFDYPPAIMYADLLEFRDKVASHSVFRAIMIDDEFESESDSSANESKSGTKENGYYHVCNADSSQIQVIEAVKAGKNLKVEGPPGTGKSQTIVNIIAELLAAKKTVLFVSAETTGLTVVKDKLDEVGLGHFYLDIHGEKYDLQQFQETLKTRLGSLKGERSSSDENLVNLETVKPLEDKLDKYVKLLHQPLEPTKQSPYELIGVVESARSSFPDGYKLLNIPIDTPDRIKNTKVNLEELEVILKSIENTGFPTKDLPKFTTRTSKQDSQVVEKCYHALNNLMEQFKSFDPGYYKDSLLEDTLKNLCYGAEKFEEFKKTLKEKSAKNTESVPDLSLVKSWFEDKWFKPENRDEAIEIVDLALKDLEEAEEAKKNKSIFAREPETNWSNVIKLYNSAMNHDRPQQSLDTIKWHMETFRKYLKVQAEYLKVKIFEKVFGTYSTSQTTDLDQLEKLMQDVINFKGVLEELEPDEG